MVPGKVSLITAVYNKEKYVANSIEHSLAMNYPNFELIIVNDGSTDNSRNIIKHYEGDSRVRVIDQTNQGSPTALRNGVAAATGGFFIRCDADDWEDPEYINETMPRMQEKEVGAVCPHTWLEGDVHYVTRTENFGDPRYAAGIQQLMIQNWLPNGLVRMDAYHQTPGFNPAAGIYSDWNLWIDITKRGWKIALVDKPLHHYRITYLNDSNCETSQIVGKHKENFKKIRDLHPDLWLENSPYPVFCPDCNQGLYLNAKGEPVEHVCERRRCGECGKYSKTVAEAQQCQEICGRRNREAAARRIR